ncbi:nucleoside-diphosphate sugar epimerase [Sphingobacteriaceae bacterium]|nr:nucleoside-diphosphate sugar epimerase [Sphingobacteriaceae bacterium]
MSKKAIIAGATGLIGAHLLRILLEAPEYSEVLILVRKPIALKHPKLKQHVLNFDKLHDYTNLIKGDVLFSCLGTTRKKTPDRKDYYKIDHDYPVILGEIAKQNSIPQYHLISAIGADPNSAIFYSRMKGETERDLAKLNLPVLFIYQPSMLAGNREEHRVLERSLILVWRVLNPLLIGSLKKYRSINAETLALALYKNSLQEKKASNVFTYKEIQELLTT